MSGPFDFKVRTVAAQSTLSIRGPASMAALPQAIGGFLSEVFGSTARRGLAPAGMPFTRLHKISGDTVELEAGIPVNAGEGEGRVVRGELPGGLVIAIDHFGSYDGLADARGALRQWAREHGYVEAGAPWEIYWTDPGAEPDPRQWRTEIVLPVRRA